VKDHPLESTSASIKSIAGYGMAESAVTRDKRLNVETAVIGQKRADKTGITQADDIVIGSRRVRTDISGHSVGPARLRISENKSRPLQTPVYTKGCNEADISLRSGLERTRCLLLIAPFERKQAFFGSFPLLFSDVG
jgi:hypothetical protein